MQALTSSPQPRVAVGLFKLCAMGYPMTAEVGDLPMTARLFVTLALVLGLSGGLAACGKSRLNPFNWFGQSQQRAKLDPVPVKGTDGRALAADVISMLVEPLPGGAIIRATGRAPTQGWWDAELVPRPVAEDGTLVLDFRVFPPITPTDVNTPQSREVTVAIYLSDIKLEPLTEIVVQGQGNARSSRR